MWGVTPTRRLLISNLWIENERGTPRRASSVVEWANYMAKTSREVGKDVAGDLFISTVFLGIDYNFVGFGPPILYETMIFAESQIEGQWRYTSRQRAKRGHDSIVRALLAGVPVQDVYPDRRPSLTLIAGHRGVRKGQNA